MSRAEEITALLEDAERQPDPAVRVLEATWMQLGVEDAWGEQEAKAFTWWPHELRQRCVRLEPFEAILDREGPRFLRTSGKVDGTRLCDPCPADVRGLVHGVRIETELLRDVEPSDALFEVLSRENEGSIGSAVVWNPADRRVTSTAVVRFAETEPGLVVDAAHWTLQIAGMQAGAAPVIAERLATGLAVAGEPRPRLASSEHPRTGLRSAPHDVIRLPLEHAAAGACGSGFGPEDILPGDMACGVVLLDARRSGSRYAGLVGLPVPEPTFRLAESFDFGDRLVAIPGVGVGSASRVPVHPEYGGGCRLKIAMAVAGGAGPRDANRLNLLRHRRGVVDRIVEDHGQHWLLGRHEWLLGLGIGAWSAGPSGGLRLSLFLTNCMPLDLAGPAIGFDLQARWASRLLHGLIEEDGSGDWYDPNRGW